MKLAELLLQRVQLQNDLSDQASRIQDNAQVLEEEAPLEDPELILKGQCSLFSACRYLKRFIAGHCWFHRCKGDLARLSVTASLLGRRVLDHH